MNHSNLHYIYQWFYYNLFGSPKSLNLFLYRTNPARWVPQILVSFLFFSILSWTLQVMWHFRLGEFLKDFLLEISYNIAYILAKLVHILSPFFVLHFLFWITSCSFFLLCVCFYTLITNWALNWWIMISMGHKDYLPYLLHKPSSPSQTQKITLILRRFNLGRKIKGQNIQTIKGF